MHAELIYYLLTLLSYHIVEEFNKGVYDYIIATDEAGLQGEQDSDDDDDDDDGDHGEQDLEHCQVYD